MTQAPGKREKPVLELVKLAPVRKGAQRCCKDANDCGPKLNCIANTQPENGPRTQTVGPQQVDKISEREVEVDVLKAEQDGERNTAP